MKIKLNECFESTSEFTWTPITEETPTNRNGIKDTVAGALGIIEGVFFVPDGKSRNQRWYSKQFWETVLSKPDVVSRLNNLTMFGAIGHKDTPVSDKDLNDGEVSHIVTDLWIDENNKGMGRLIVLNTESGRNLMAYMSVKYKGKGSKLKISSRAMGEYKEGVTYDGLPVVDEDTFNLNTFDVVIDPGFIETNLALKENNEKIKETEMPLTEEEIKALKKLVSESSNSNFETDKLKNENKELKEKLQSNEGLIKIVNSLTSQEKAVLEKLVNEKNTSFLTEWNEMGEPKEIKELMEKSDQQSDTLIEYIELGLPSELKTLVETSRQIKSELDVYKELGDVTEIKEALSEMEKLAPALEKLGDVNEALIALESSKKLNLQLAEKLDQEQKKNVNSKALEISKKYGQALESVKANLLKIGEKETLKLYSEIANKPNANENNSKNKSTVSSGLKGILESLNNSDNNDKKEGEV